MEDDSSDTHTCFQNTGKDMVHRTYLYFAEDLILRQSMFHTVDHGDAFLRFMRLQR